MKFIDKLLEVNFVLAIGLEILFFLVELIVFLHLMRSCTWLFYPNRNTGFQLSVSADLADKTKGNPRKIGSIYLMGLGAVVFYYLMFILWNHHPFSNGIGLLYVLVFTLGFITLLIIAFALLNKMKFKTYSRKALIANIIIDAIILIILNTLYFSF